MLNKQYIIHIIIHNPSYIIPYFTQSPHPLCNGITHSHSANTIVDFLRALGENSAPAVVPPAVPGRAVPSSDGSSSFCRLCPIQILTMIYPQQ